MNIQDAAHATVHDYPGGSESLGPRMGVSAPVLRNKVNQNNTTHHLSLSEADRMMGLTGDMRILQALAHSHGYLLVKAPDGTAASDMDVLEQVVGVSVAAGEFHREILQALSDGGVDEAEMQRVAAAAQAYMTAIHGVKRTMRAMVG